MADTSTTYSSNYQIKLIGTGQEAGSWGASTNINWQRIEQAMGGYVNINPITGTSSFGSMTSSDAAGATDGTMIWVTSETSDYEEANSEGRSFFVEFSGASLGDYTRIKIRGSTQAETSLPERVYLIKNSMDVGTGGDLILNCENATDDNQLTIKNGCYAFVVSCPTDRGSVAQGVNNLLSKLQIDNLVFPDGADATVTIADNRAAALTIDNGTDTFLTFDSTTDNDKIDVAVPLNSSGSLQIDATTSVDINSPLIDLEDQATSIKLNDDDTAALDIYETDSATGSYAKVNTTGSKLFLGSGSGVTTLDIGTAAIDLSLASILTAYPASEVALDIQANSASYIVLDTAATGVAPPDNIRRVVLGDVANVVDGSGNDKAPMRLDIEIPDTTFESQASTITMKAAEASALVFQDAVDAAFLTFDTAGEKITFGKPMDGVDIDGGSIDNTAIGGTTPAGGTFTQVDITGAGELRLQDTTGGEYIGMKAATETTSYSLTMPAAVGLANQVLSASDGSGTLAWTTPEVGDLESVANVTNGGIAVTDGGGPDVTLGLDFNDLAAATVSVASDSIGIIDADDNSTKKESIADLVSAMGGTGLTGASGLLSVDPSQTQITEVGIISSGTWEGATVAVNKGGTGATSLTNHGVLLGSGTGAVTVTSALGDGEILIGDGVGDPTTLDVGSSTEIKTLGTVTTGVWNGTAITGDYIDVTSSPLADTNIWIGDASGDAAEFALSGDATMTAGGVVTVSTAAACSGNAATASEVSISASSLDATNYLAFVDSSTGTDHIGINTGLTFNPSDNKMTFDGLIDTVIAAGSVTTAAVATVTVSTANINIGLTDQILFSVPATNDEYTVIFPSDAGSDGDYLKIATSTGGTVTLEWSAT